MSVRAVLVSCVALAIVGPVAAPAAADPLVPPEVLAPADGATSAAGAPVTFRVRSDPGDGFLWVLFSASPSPAAPCGTIGRDLGLRSLEATPGDPTVYEATPPMYDTYTFWLNRPGTYYWQAYRIQYGGGADGCIEAPVRSLTVTGRRPIEIGPTPVTPADGVTLLTGPQTFTATGLPADDHLWLHVSRSSMQDTTGRLNSDVEIERMTPSGAPGTFVATPEHRTFPTFWMNVPGRYYWQPHRISGFGDPDGFVEGPVRSFTLRKAPSVFGAGGVVVAPSTKRCVSRRRFRIRIRRIAGISYQRVEVRLRGRLVRTVRGSRIYANIDLRGLPKGRWKVEIRAITTTGRTLKGTRTYRTCTAKSPGTNTSPL